MILRLVVRTIRRDGSSLRELLATKGRVVLGLLAGARDDPSLPASGLTSSDPFTIRAVKAFSSTFSTYVSVRPRASSG